MALCSELVTPAYNLLYWIKAMRSLPKWKRYARHPLLARCGLLDDPRCVFPSLFSPLIFLTVCQSSLRIFFFLSALSSLSLLQQKRFANGYAATVTFLLRMPLSLGIAAISVRDIYSYFWYANIDKRTKEGKEESQDEQTRRMRRKVVFEEVQPLLLIPSFCGSLAIFAIDLKWMQSILKPRR